MLLPSVPLDAIRQPALLYDAGGRVVAANDRVEALAGRTLAGASIAEIRDAFRQRAPGGAALTLDELPASRALRGEEAVDVPLVITAADGRTVPVLATASPLWDGDAVTGALVVWQDVSGLVESEVMYRTLFDSIDEGFFLVDVIFNEQDRPVDLLYVEANAAAVRMLGQDWTGRRLTELSPDYERYWFEIFGKVARTGERVRLERYAAPDRTWYDFSVFRVGGPESRRVGNTFLDITERKRAEAALADSEAKYRSFESLTEGLIVLEPVLGEDGVPASFRWLDVNPAFERLTPLRRDEIIGRDVREVLPALSPSWVETLARVAETGEPAQGEIHDPDHGGWYSVYAFRPTPGRVAVLLSNVTERRESEERFRSVLDHSLDALYRLDLRTSRYVYTSPACERVLGRSAEEMESWAAEKGMGWIHPDDLPVVAAGRARLEETGSAEVEYRVLDRDGRYRWVSNHLSLVRDESGRPLYRDGVVRDITAQKEAKEALKESEALFRGTFDQSPLGIALVRPDFTLARANAALCRMLGYTEDELRRTTLAEFTHPDDLDVDLQLAGELEAGAIDRYTIDKRYIRRDGTVIWGSLSVSLLRDADGRVRYYIPMVEEVTARKEAEQALAASEARYRELFESMNEGFALCEIVLDDAGRPVDYRFLAVNPAFEAMTGFAADTAVGRLISELQPGLQPVWIERYGRVALTGTPERFVEYSAPLGRWFDIYAFSPAPGRFASLFRDVTEERRAAEALAESEAKYRSLFESLDAGFCIIEVLFDEDGEPVDYVFLEANPAFVQQTGLSDAIGKRMRDLEPSHEEHWFQIYGEIARTGEHRRFVQGAMPLIGGWYEVYAFPSGAPGSNRVAILFNDITERKRQEEALRESEKRMSSLLGDVQQERDRLASLIDSIGDEIWFADTDRHFTLANPRAIQEFALSSGDDVDVENLAKSLEVFRPDGSPRPVEEAPPLRALAGEVVRDQEEVIRMPATGELRYRQVSSSPVRDGAETIIGSVSVVRDITEQKKAEAALAESEANMARAQTAAHLGNWKWDLATNVLSCSDEHCRLYGLAPGDYPLGTFIDLVHEDDRQAVRDTLAETVNKGTPYDVECRVVRQDGAERVLHGEGEAIRDRDGRVTGLFGIAQDITERKKTDEALREYARDLERSNEDLERFAYVASHDLQEPLRPIVSFSQLLERRYKGRLDADADEYIEFIVEGGNRMQALILDLLAYSRANSMPLERHPTDVEAVVASVERSLDHQLREAGAVITRDPLPTVMADPIQLEQVFVNLVSNAVKFRRPDVPLRVHVGVRREDALWEFSVVDNGIGIEEHYFDQLFVIFKRLHTRDAYPGTGIGLPIVKRIVDRHGGRVRVESVPGKGSTFFFTLPAS